MSTTNIQPLPSVRGRMRYTELGEGAKYTSNVQNGTDRIADQMGDMGSREEFTLHCEAMRRQHPQRSNEGFEVRVSWAPEEMDINKSEDVQRAKEYGYLLCKEIAPESACWVTVHTDGEGGCLHVHAAICNHDETTGKALAHGMSHKRVAAINDRLSIENGFSVVGKPAFVKDVRSTWAERREECSPFEQRLGDTVQHASSTSTDENEFRQALKEQGVDVKEYKGGWSYHMMDDTGPKRRKRRRKASNLADDLTKDAIEERFRQKQAEREASQKHQNAPESRFNTLGDKTPEEVRKAPEKAAESVSGPSGDEKEDAPSLLDDYQVEEEDVKGCIDALKRRSRQHDPTGSDWRTKDVRSADSADVRARLQAEVDRCREAFKKSKDALDSMRPGSNSSLAMLNRMFVQMSRGMSKPADRMAADMLAQMMAMLWQMERERIERERREALERDLYEKRGEMWDAEKQLKAADKALTRELSRNNGRHIVSSRIEDIYEQAQRLKKDDGVEYGG